MEVDAIVRGTCLGEDKLEKTSDKYDTSYTLIQWFVLNDHFNLLFEMINLMCLYWWSLRFWCLKWSKIPVVNILSLFESEFTCCSCCLIDMIDCSIVRNRLKVLLIEIIFFLKVQGQSYVSLYICAVVVVTFHNDTIT